MRALGRDLLAEALERGHDVLVGGRADERAEEREPQRRLRRAVQSVALEKRLQHSVLKEAPDLGCYGPEAGILKKIFGIPKSNSLFNLILIYLLSEKKYLLRSSLGFSKI